MNRKPFLPTDEQKEVLRHRRSAFISACPGAGKTQVLIERARRELGANRTDQGLAFLSFTNAAISELRSRLQSGSILPNPIFPHYVGTFDTFIWQFFILGSALESSFIYILIRKTIEKVLKIINNYIWSYVFSVMFAYILNTISCCSSLYTRVMANISL